MKVRSLKQTLHWLFLAVGIISIFLMAVTVNTYFSYAKEGYGLDVEFNSANLVDNGEHWIRIRLSIHNPGRLDMQLEDANLTLNGEEHPLPVNTPDNFAQVSPISDLPMRETITIVMWFRIIETNFDQVASTGLADLRLDMTIFVIDRYAWVPLVFEDTVEVSPP